MYSFFDKKTDLLEGLQTQELRDLIHNEIHIDEFQAKMGEDDQIIVVSFKIKYKAAAADLESFLEKGYDFILDAESSKAEFENGWYLVFVEFERRLGFPEKLVDIMRDMKNITNVKGWKFRYGPSRRRNTPEWPVTVKNLNKVIPLSPHKYRELQGIAKEEENSIDNMIMASEGRIVTKDKTITESQYHIRLAAGIPVDGYNIISRGRR